MTVITRILILTFPLQGGFRAKLSIMGISSSKWIALSANKPMVFFIAALQHWGTETQNFRLISVR